MNKTTSKSTLFFGCTGLEQMIDANQLGYSLNKEGSFVTCIVGPDGVGKSILSLAAASSYAAMNAAAEDQRIIYASTDLNYDQAKSTWNHFGFSQPGNRQANLLKKVDQFSLKKPARRLVKQRAAEMNRCDRVRLRWISPFESLGPDDPKKIKPYGTIFEEKPITVEPCVHFLDLAQFSAGDDWGHLNRTLGLLKDLEARSVSAKAGAKKTKSALPPHLMIVDAVEGLEAMVGERDGFGLERSRRSRLAQMVRIARKVNCSLVFVVEQKHDNVRLDEVFVSDLVIRLRTRTKDNYLMKTVEVEKARSKAHIRGEHEFQIRSGQGVCGAGDDPTLRQSKLTKGKTVKRRKVEPGNAQPGNSELVDDRAVTAESTGETLPLDQVQEEKVSAKPVTSMSRNRTERPFGYLQVLPSLHVKDELTANVVQGEFALKDRFPVALDSLNQLLSRSHAANGATEKSSDPKDRILVLVGNSRTYKTNLGFAFLAQAFAGSAALENEPSETRSSQPKSKETGGALLLTSEGTSHEQVMAAFDDWKAQCPDRNLVVREIPPRFLSSSDLLFRIRVNIRKLKKKLKLKKQPENIRVLVDNWATILESHPSIQNDPQILQRVFRLLQREGVTAMITATQAGSPDAQVDLEHEHSVMRLEARRLHTWPVDFYGERRIAIASSIAGRTEAASFVYELRRADDSNYLLTTTNDFSVYKDLETGHAKPIELNVKLYSGYHTDRVNAEKSPYAEDVAALFGDLYHADKSSKEVVSFENIERYSGFREYVKNLQGSKLDHSLVFQADEFWQPQENVLASLKESWDPEKRKIFRKEYRTDEPRVPLHRDFGLLLLDRQAWESAQDNKVDGFIVKKVRVPPVDVDLETDLKDIQFEEREIVLDAPSNFAEKGSETDWFSTCIQANSFSEKQLAWLLRNPEYFKDLSSIHPLDATLSVGQVYEALTHNAGDPPSETLSPGEEDAASRQLQIPWAAFFAATRIVGRKTGKSPFEIDMRTIETLNCLTLEIWYSAMKQSVADELFKKLDEENVFQIEEFGAASTSEQPSVNLESLLEKVINNSCLLAKNERGKESLDWAKMAEESLDESIKQSTENKESRRSGDKPQTEALDELLINEHSRKLLIESISMVASCLPSRFRQGTVESDKPTGEAVAIRSWYATGVLTQKELPGLIPARLPGSYSVRGDWFLSVVNGSRSLDLADQAIGNLTSTSMNLKRYREGVGLPVRDFSDLNLVESALTTPEDHRARRMSLEEIERLGPATFEEFSRKSNSEECSSISETSRNKEQVKNEPEQSSDSGGHRWSTYRPLFRSQIKNYGLQSDEFGRLIAHLLHCIEPDLKCADMEQAKLDNINAQCRQVAKCCKLHSKHVDEPDEPGIPEGKESLALGSVS